MNIPSKAKTRLVTNVKKYKRVLTKAVSQDVNESDTVTVTTDMLSDIFGYDKYEEITSEFAIKKTFCDLAIKLNDQVKLLIEVKSVGTNLKDNHLKQATDYGANAGIDWVILTNGVAWKVYRIIFSKPIEHELVYEFDMTQINTHKDEDLSLLYLLCRETINKKNSNALDEYRQQKELLNKVMLGQIILSEPVLSTIRRTMKKVSAEAKVTKDEISEVISSEVIKRDVLEDEKAEDYTKQITRAIK